MIFSNIRSTWNSLHSSKVDLFLWLVSFFVFLIAFDTHIFIQTKSKYYQGPHKKETEFTKILDISVEVCSFLKKGRISDTLTALLIGILKKNGKLFTKCPIPIGFYYAYNMTFNGIDLPPIMRNVLGSKDAILTFEIDVKGTDKKWYKMGNLTFWGGYTT